VIGILSKYASISLTDKSLNLYLLQVLMQDPYFYLKLHDFVLMVGAHKCSMDVRF
jgi:hypothetical protein